MPEEPSYKIVPVHVFKDNFCQYLVDLMEGKYKGIVVRRYKRELAALMPLRSEADRDEERAQLELRRARFTMERFAAARRHWRGHLLSWPLAEKFPGQLGQH